jgi:myo-inositol-1(or 4)-monophosphatase
MSDLRDLLTGLAQAVRDALDTRRTTPDRRSVHGESPGGDAQFDIDEIAEQVVRDHLRERGGPPLAVYTEDAGLWTTGDDPEYVLVVDPIDGTRPASAGLEMATVSIAAARLGDGDPTLGDVIAAHVLELKTGAGLYADDDTPGIEAAGHPYPVPALSPNTELSRMFWSIEFNGHPMDLMTRAYRNLVDRSANTGGVFVFNSASYSITRVITGQLDAYVDIGNRVLRDRPETEPAFRAAGRGSVLHLFPYDIAASVYLARRAQVTITDAYGDPLDAMRLLDLSPLNQRSCVAASTPQLHKSLLENIRWDLPATPEVGAPQAPEPASGSEEPGS